MNIDKNIVKMTKIVKMKKIVYFASAVLLVLSSCTNEIGEESFVDKTNSISFDAYAYKTRAANYVNGDVSNSTEMRDGSFGVVGYTTIDNRLYLGTINKAIEQEWNSSSEAWDYAAPAELKYWPSCSMNFYAYFPYSASDDVFASTDNEADQPVMTIKNESGNQDVLFASHRGVSQTDKVGLNFKHAFSKIKSLTIQVNAEYVEVEVSKVKFLNTSTKGKIKVNNAGNASYETTENDEPRSFDLTPQTITKANINGVDLFGNEDNGYVFATNDALEHYVTGTGKDMWDGNKASLSEGTLSESDFICMELTCKVKAANHYLVGSERSYGTMYIPMRGTGANSENISELLAGRRYSYKVVMASNVGYDNNGDPIMLAPIRFAVNGVAGWDDVTVTITL